MKQLMTIFNFTLKDGIKKKAFIISTIVILLIIVIVSCIPRVIDIFSGDDGKGGAGGEQKEFTCYYIDEGNLIPGGDKAIENAYPDTEIRTGKASDMEDYRKKVNEGEDIFVISITEKEKLPYITITVKDFMTTVDMEGITETLSKTYGAGILKAKGFTDEDVATAQSILPYETKMSGNLNVSTYGIAIALTFVMFFAIYYYGYGVAMSIATEKASRVMETLVVSAKPSRILVGKCMAMGTLGLIQFCVILLVGAICFITIVPEDFTIMGMSLDVNTFTVKTVIGLLIFFILGYALYAVMNSVCGALVSKIEDLNSAMMPVMMIAMVSFYVAYVTGAVGSDGTVAKIAMYIPFTSPFIMPFRLLNNAVTAVDFIISLVAMIAAIIVITAVSVKIYSVSVLNYGKRQKLRKLYRTKL